jgi:hypothetical protein
MRKEFFGDTCALWFSVPKWRQSIHRSTLDGVGQQNSVLTRPRNRIQMFTSADNWNRKLLKANREL